MLGFADRILQLGSLRLKLLIFAAAAVTILLLWAIIPDRYFARSSWDYDYAYRPLANTILNGHAFIWTTADSAIRPPGDLARFPPGYTLIVAATVGAAENLRVSETFAIYVLNLAATAICAVCLFSIASSVFGRLASLAAPLLWLTYPILLLVTRQPASEIPFCALQFAAIDLLWSAIRSKAYRPGKFFGCGLLLGCAMLVRAQAIGLGIVLAGAVFSFARQLPIRVRLTCAAMLLIGNLVAILPWEVWVYRHTGNVVALASEGNTSICDGLTFAVDLRRPGRKRVELPEDLRNLSLDFLAECNQSSSTGQTMEFVAAQLWHRPAGMLELGLIKAVRSWYATSSGNLDKYILGFQLAYALLFIWATAAALRDAGSGRLLALIVLSVVVYTWAMTIVVFSMVRYMLPAAALLFVLAPAVLRRGTRARAAAGAAVLAALLTLVASPRVAIAMPCTTSILGPNDPEYAPAELAPGTGLSFNAEDWYLFDCIPQSTPKAFDPEGSSGMFLNEAWAKYGFGRTDLIVAYVEGGINWRQTETADLRLKPYLNCGELPAPERADGSTMAGSSPGCLEPGKSYDLDGDGVLTPDDYANDPRVPTPFIHHATAGGISSEDLIVAFSDGVDNDHNGYVDDISGWNFHRDTNDPQTDNSAYEHPDGESAQFVAEANNGLLGVGVCPNCRLLSIKAGDEAIDRPDRVAEAIAFAADSGAKVIDVTESSIAEAPVLAAAIDYAYQRGAVLVWASNDFESADHTDGMRFAHVWPGNSIVSDRSNRSGASSPSDAKAQTFRSRSSLTSYGPHNLFSVPNDDGSTSTGTPTLAGVAAMVVSAGLDASQSGQIASPLSPNEVEQVVRSTASPIDYQPCKPNCFAGEPGAEFNIQYGYGRPNVLKAMDAVHANAIPPMADIQSPGWYTEIDPTITATLPVSFVAAAPRSSSYNWQLQYATGPQPLDKSFTSFATGSGTAAQTVTSSLDLSKIPKSFWSGTYHAPTKTRLSIEQYDVTIRLVVTDKRSLIGEDRRVFHLRHDSTERPGFPIALGTSLEVGVTMADIEGTGMLDMILGGSDGSVHVIRPDGTEAPGFPVMTNLARGVDPNYPFNYLGALSWQSGQIPFPHDAISGPLAVGDLDHDGALDIIAASSDGFLYVWDGLGKLRAGFPVFTNRAFQRQSVPPPDTPYSTNPMTGQFGGAALGDLEGTGQLDLVMAGWDGEIYVWRPDGSLVPGWPVDAVDIPPSAIPANDIFARDFKIATQPTLIDINGDGHPDVMFGIQDTAFPASETPVTGFLTAFSSQGTLLPNFPVGLYAEAQGNGTATDIVTEGVQTPVAFTLGGVPTAVANPDLYLNYVIDLSTGKARVNSPAIIAGPGTVPALVHFTTSASMGNLKGGKVPQIIQAGTDAQDIVTGITDTPGIGVRLRSGISVWDPTSGDNLSQYTQLLQGLPFFAAPAIADVSGDGVPDIVIGTDSAALHAFDGHSGRPLAGWPKWTGGWVLSTPAVGDLTGSGEVEVAVTTREGYLHVYTTPGRASANHEAWHAHQNDWNTGLYGQDTRPPSAISDLVVAHTAKGDELQFTAVGDDWKSGRAASYQAFAAAAPITQGNVASATAIAISAKPKSAGSKESILVTPIAGLGFYAVRAIDKAGNIGPLPLRAPGASQ